VQVSGRRPLWVALFASLAVNVFLIAWVGMTWVSESAPNPRRSSTMRSDFRPYTARRALAEEQRATVDRIWRERRPQTRAAVSSLRDARLGFSSALTADQLDRTALDAAVATLRQRSDAALETMTGTLMAIAAELPPEVRKAYFAAGFTRPGRRRDSN
jgi:uncharacterized membrane protein